jgi:hypothetical protein
MNADKDGSGTLRWEEETDDCVVMCGLKPNEIMLHKCPLLKIHVTTRNNKTRGKMKHSFQPWTTKEWIFDYAAKRDETVMNIKAIYKRYMYYDKKV